jgi:histidyl-tRNA synthetase
VIPRLKGTDDILPPDSERWRRLLRAFDLLAERYGYDLALMPVIEATELFARGVGETSEVVEKQMYSFEDRGNRSITLRPEFTAGIVRSYIDSGSPGVMKLAAAGPQFRYEQPQKGRRRQFFQVDLEYLGEPAPGADVEIIEFSYRLLEMVGVEGVGLRLNSIGDASDRVAYRALLQEYLRDHETDLSEDARRRIATNPLRVLDSKADTDVVAGAPVPIDHLSPEAADHFGRVRSALDVLGVAYELEPRLVRGLDYYNRTVFEFYASSFEAAQSSLGGGGRYDPLAELIGARHPVSAVGVAMGCDRIVAAMAASSGPRLDLYVAVAESERADGAMTWVADLRHRGLRVDWDASRTRSLKSQFKAANRGGAAVVAIVGTEWDEGMVAVKVMSTGEEHQVPVEEVVEWTKQH